MAAKMVRKIAEKKVLIVKAVNVVLVACLVVGYSLWATEAAEADAAVEAQIEEAERAANAGPYAADGTFTGSAQGYGGTVTVQVEIENGYVEEVSIVSADGEDDAYLNMASSLLDEISSEQTTNIDTVTGATYTSAGILNAAMEALEQSNASTGGK